MQPESYPKQYQSTAINTDRYSNREDSNRSVKSRSSSLSAESNLPVRPSVLSTYGSNSLERNQVSQQLPASQQQVNVVFSHTNDTA